MKVLSANSDQLTYTVLFCNSALIYLHLIPVLHLLLSGHSLCHRRKSESFVSFPFCIINTSILIISKSSFCSYWNFLTLQGLAQSHIYSEIHIAFTVSSFTLIRPFFWKGVLLVLKYIYLMCLFIFPIRLMILNLHRDEILQTDLENLVCSSTLCDSSSP